MDTTTSSMQEIKPLSTEELNMNLKKEIVLEMSTSAPPKTRRKEKTTRPRGKNIINCPDCSFTTDWNSKLKKHYDAVHRKLRPFQCKECDYKAYNRSRLTQHVKTVHLQLKPFRCDSCEYSTSRRDHLKDHIKNAHLKMKRHKCDVDGCEMRFKGKVELISHQRTVHGIGELEQCELCDFKAGTKNMMKKHIIKYHNNDENNFKCDLCTYSTPFEDDLSKHKNRRHNPEKEKEMNIKKEIAKKRFQLIKKDKDYRMKQEADLYGEKEYTCSKCSDFTTNSPVHFENHMVIVHRHSFQCKNCSFKTIDKMKMKAHIVEHNAKSKQDEKFSGKNYSCKICSYKTTSVNLLKSHIRNSHKPQVGKPFSCEKCSYRTGFQELLEKHQESEH